MDRNSAIGLLLIGLILFVYFYYFNPTPPEAESPALTEQQVPTQIQETPESPEGIAKDSLGQPGAESLAMVAKGKKELKQIENEDLIISFSNLGATIDQIELKKFKSYSKQPLILASEKSHSFSLLASFQGNEIDLYNIFYEVTTKSIADTMIVTYSTKIGNGTLKHHYAIPNSGYEVNYWIETSGLNLNGQYLTYQWRDKIPKLEKDIIDARNKTAVNYYLPGNDDFDGLSETSMDPESEVLAAPVQWIAIKQKFFVNSIIAKNNFAGGEISTTVNQADTTTVKDAKVKLFIPVEHLATNQAQFRYYFGPLDHKILKGVAPEFSRNLYLGWPPVIWVNKFLIIPIFKFLERFIGNYGIIIIILVLAVKILLTPLSYKSYMGMAKMKLLKPELDVIKEQFGDDMSKVQQEQMKLYQQAGVNPFSGCIPLVLQMPILFAMFYFFPVSIELRQQPFLWADDLSTYDSIMTLPFTIPLYGSHVSLFVLLMTASTIIYTWQNNQISSVQGPMKSMSYIMPVIFMFVLNSFSAGLSFYYFVSNLVTFGQQAIIKKFVDEDKIKNVMDEHKKKMASGTGKKSGFMARLEDAMKASQEARKKGK
ncbi:MAG: membrane protein insertase YidC [Flammeovirgaceae bacterium]|nr:membrane protein insertase YidC [Flammeovirgaceae bacterium]